MPLENVKDILLATQLDPQQVAALLSPYGFRDPAKADANLQSIAGEPAERELLAEILEHLLSCVSRSANPDQALTYLERFAQAALNRTRLFSYLKETPRMTEVLARTMGGSAYMAEILIRDPHHFYWVTEQMTLDYARKKRDIQRELVQTLRVLEDEKKQLDYLRFFKRKEMLHIGVRDLLRLCPVQETLSALSLLAETLISAAHSVCATALRAEYGLPANAFSGYTILAMGKLGGGELNFSSDVDLLYLYVSDNDSDSSISAADYFRRLSQRITAGLNDLTAEGYVYRVDLRLRPEGMGDIAIPLDGFERYYRTRLRTWERMALLKVWPVAGNRALGNAFLEMSRPFVYDLPFDAKSLQDVRNMKRQIDEKMSARQQREVNVKLGAGGIREIELIAQTLQIRSGGTPLEIRERNTLKALSALCAASLLSGEDCTTLTNAYIFLRDVENKLQMVNDAQTHSLPQDYEELNACARLLGYEGAEPFLKDYQHHTGHVKRIFENRFSEST